MNIIFKRQSVRNFLYKPVEDSKIDRILKAGMQAPSAHNFQPWEFLIVKNPEMRKQIASLSIYGKPAEKCDTCIVVLANMDRVAKENRWWQQDMGACMENMLLQAVEEGLGTVWLGYYPEKERVEGMKQLFHLPDHIITFAVIAVGYPEKQQDPALRYDTARIHYEKYGEKLGV